MKSFSLNDPNTIRLVSYPRTGSHWLRLLIEVYTGFYCYPQKFFSDTNPKKIWGIHIHNRIVAMPDKSEGLQENLRKIIYLYRNPVDTIYSQLKYDKVLEPGWSSANNNKDLDNKIDILIQEYRNHLIKWKNNAQNCNEYIEISYGELKNDTPNVLKKIINFIAPNHKCNMEHLQKISEKITKEATKKVTPYDPNALNDEIVKSPELYEYSRNEFIKKYAGYINKNFNDIDW